MIFHRTICLLSAALLAGCATVSTEVPLPANHPANPDAPEAAMATPSRLTADEATLHTARLLAPPTEQTVNAPAHHNHESP